MVWSGFAGKILDAGFSIYSANRAAKLQRENWKYMQQNAHQYEVQDLRNAGLNPILSATNGQIAPAGSAPTGTNIGFGETITSARNADKKQMTDLSIADMQNKVALGQLEVAEGKLDLERSIASWDIEEKKWTIENVKANTQKVWSDIKNSTNLANADIAYKMRMAEHDFHRMTAYVSNQNAQASASHEQVNLFKANIKRLGSLNKLTDTQVKEAISNLTVTENENKLTNAYLTSEIGRVLQMASMGGQDLDGALTPVWSGLGAYTGLKGLDIKGKSLDSKGRRNRRSSVTDYDSKGNIIRSRSVYDYDWTD